MGFGTRIFDPACAEKYAVIFLLSLPRTFGCGMSNVDAMLCILVVKHAPTAQLNGPQCKWNAQEQDMLPGHKVRGSRRVCRVCRAWWGFCRKSFTTNQRHQLPQVPMPAPCSLGHLVYPSEAPCKWYIQPASGQLSLPTHHRPVVAGSSLGKCSSLGF